jgi:hypothetical protein
LEKYVIYYTVDSGNVLYAGFTDASTRNFTFENLIPESTYCFFVKAVNQQGAITASSTRFCFLYAVQDNNDFVYIRSVLFTKMKQLQLRFIQEQRPVLPGFTYIAVLIRQRHSNISIF